MELTLIGLQPPFRLHPEQPLTEDQLLHLSAANEALQIEQEPNGDLTIMSSGGIEVGDVDAEVNFQLRAWVKGSNAGKTFGSSAGFRLPDGSVRSPDASFLSWSKWNALTREEARSYGPVCPEFVVEVRSPTDRLKVLRTKMQTWIANGVQLAWLIDPERKVVEVSRAGQAEAEIMDGISAVYGEGPVDGFVLELAPVWQ